MPAPFAVETAAARIAQRAWFRRPIRDRLKPVRAFRAKLVDSPEELLTAIEADVHRPPGEVLATDLLSTAAAAKFLEQQAGGILKSRRIGGSPLWLLDVSTRQIPMPHGIVGIIGTWNYPLFLNAVPILQALVAGNAVLWKPSEQTPQMAAVLHRWLLESGFPPELVPRLPATREAGPDLVEADIDFLHFTGSDRVGRKLAARLGERLIPSTMELSGVDAALVLADADLELAARTVVYGATLNKGQTCIATRRVFVDRSVIAAFTEKLRPLMEATTPVKLQMPGQLEQFHRLVADGIERGGTPIRSTAPVADGFCSPTSILNGTPEMALCHEACFSPILAVIPVDSTEAMIGLANANEFGLAASVYSRSVRSLPELRVGTVVFNDTVVPTAHPATPFGGRGVSGWGPTQGVEGLQAMTYPQVIARRWGWMRPHVDAGLNPNPALGEAMLGLLRFSHGRGIGQRWRGFWKMARGFRQLGKSI